MDAITERPWEVPTATGPGARSPGPWYGRPRGMWSRATGLAVAMLLICAAPAVAPQPTGPFAAWDGTNPFNSTIQDLGTGNDFPDPRAHPLCVKFAKTQQNVTDLGLLDFPS